MLGSVTGPTGQLLHRLLDRRLPRPRSRRGPPAGRAVPHPQRALAAVGAPDFSGVEPYFLDLQDRLCRGVAAAGETAAFPGGRLAAPRGGRRADAGARRRRGLRAGGGRLLPRRAGPGLPPSATAHRPELAGRRFEALGVSLVFHPRNPYVPTAHMNVRFFVAEQGRARAGLVVRRRLRPHARTTASRRTPCTGTARRGRPASRSAPRSTRASSGWCDDYFFLRHRGEPRGIGGCSSTTSPRAASSAASPSLRSVGDHFLAAYLPIVERRKDTPYGERERDFQLYRRGRYVEFNLVYDRGTLFGLQSGGRTESILMSLPPAGALALRLAPGAGHARGASSTSSSCAPRDWADEPVPTAG